MVGGCFRVSAFLKAKKGTSSKKRTGPNGFALFGMLACSAGFEGKPKGKPKGPPTGIPHFDAHQVLLYELLEK